MDREILLTQGYVAIVDSEDYELVSQYKWRATKFGNKYYATATNPKNLSMHRLIMQAKEGQEIDHRNTNGLDNRRENLRFCTRTQNHANRVKKIGTSSNYKGVTWDTFANKWKAAITVNYLTKNLGRYVSEIEAAKTYDEAALNYFGEFARLNFSKEGV